MSRGDSARGVWRRWSLHRRPAPRHAAFSLEPLEPRTLLAVILWDGGGDGVTLTQAANWAGDVTPGAADEAVIDIAATPTVTHDAGTADFLRLTCAENISIGGSGSLILGAASVISGTATLSLTSTITGAGDLTFSGAVTWNGGTLSGAGTVIVATGATMDIVMGDPHTLARPFLSDGTVNITGTAGATLNATDGWIIRGTLNVIIPVTISGPLAPDFIRNEGTINNFASVILGLGVAFHNLGTLNINDGTTTYLGGGIMEGEVNIDAGTTLNLASDFTHEPGAVYAGPGTLQLDDVQTFTGDVTIACATTLAGTLAGVGDVTFTNSLAWTDGAMIGAGETVIGAGATASIGPAGTLALRRVLRNQGTATIAGATLQLLNGTIVNEFDLEVTGPVTLSSGGGTNLVRNEGTLTIGANWTVETGVRFENAGTLTINTGTATLAGGGLMAGPVAITAPASLVLNSNFTHQAGAAYTGTGTLLLGGVQTFSVPISIPNPVTLQGTLTGASDVTFTGALAWTSGTMSGTGATTIGAPGTLTTSTSGAKTLSRTLRIQGSLNAGGGSITLNNGMLLNIGTATIALTGPFAGGGGTNLVRNEGAMTFTSADADLASGVRFENIGTLTVSGAGPLAMSGGGLMGGPVTLGAGANLQLFSSFTHQAGAAYSGAGTLTLNNAPAHVQTFTAPITIATATTLQAGTLTGAGDVTFAGTATWAAGTMSGTGATIIGPAATMTMTGGGAKTLSRELRVQGTLVTTGGNLALSGGTLLIAPAGAMNITQPLALTSGGGTNLVRNEGTITSTAGWSTAGAVPFESTGTLNVNAGSATLNGGGTVSGPVVIASGATLDFAGDFTHAPGAAYSGAGDLLLGGVQTFTGALGIACPTTLSGTLTGDPDVTFTNALDWTGGAMTGTGTTIIGPAGTLTVSGGGARTLARELVVQGDADLLSGVTIQMENGRLVNQGSMAIGGNVIFTGVSGTNAVENSGTLVKFGGAGLAFNNPGPSGVRFNNLPTGVAALNSGTVTLGSGGHNQGIITVAPAALLIFGANYTHTNAGYAGDGTVRFNAGTHTFAGDSTFACPLQVAGGTLTGAGNVAIQRPLTWTGGAISGTGTTTLEAGAPATINGPVTLARTLVSNESIDHTGGPITFAGGTLTNAPGAVYALSGDASMSALTGTNLFSNLGVFNKDGTGTNIVAVPFDNGAGGTLNTFGGELALAGGGTNTGARNTVAGAVLRLAGDWDHGAGSTQAGGGTAIWENGAHTISGDWTAATFLTWNNITLTGPGTLTTSGPITWTGGTLDGPGGLVIAPGGKITIASGSPHTINAPIQNNGTILWDADALTLNGTLTNAANGALFIRTAAGAATGTGTLTNLGRLVKQTAGAASFTGVTLDNTGSVQVKNGSLTLGPVAQAQGSTLAGGSWEVLPNTTLNITGAALTTIGTSATVRIVGATANFAALSGLNRNLGSLEIVQSIFSLTPSGGTFTNEGTLKIGAGAVFRLTGTFAQTAAGSLAIDISGTAGGQIGRISATGASLAGSLTVALLGGFVPAPGNSFRLVSGPGLTGTFAPTSLPPAGAMQYNASQALLVF